MKTILLPTDFSKISSYAINYAVKFAKSTKSKIILFHVYHVPIVTSDVPLSPLSLTELENDCMNSLKKIRKRISVKNGNNLIIECICKCGLAVDEIKYYTEANNISLIIMGMNGAGYISEHVIGSITTTLIKKTKCPILVISKDVIFKSVENIVLACETFGIKNKSVLDPLKEFAEIFKSKISVLNVFDAPEGVPSLYNESTPGFSNLQFSLTGTKHTFHYSKNTDVINGINDFVEDHKANMVVMIAHEHSFFQRIFHEPNTKKMAFHTRLPLLILQE